MGSFDILARLAKQAVDRERRVLQEIHANIMQTELHIDELAKAARSETDRGADFMTAGATLSAYLQANEQRIQAAKKRLTELRTTEAEQLAKLQRERVELKRYELLAERRARRIADALEAKEQKKIDELLVTRKRLPQSKLG